MKYITGVFVGLSLIFAVNASDYQQKYIKTKENLELVTSMKNINFAIQNKLTKLKKENEPFKLIEKYTGIDYRFVKTQAMLETGHFTSRRYKNNHNMFGIGVYNDKVEGHIYLDNNHCAYHYAYIINNNYKHLNNVKTIEEFASGLNKWATDKQYKQKIIKLYYKEFGSDLNDSNRKNI